MSPGRGGFTPQLQLSYDSGSGNGPFGFGWSISLPCITRRTDRGLPRYNDDEESDVFILAGSEDLVPVLDGTGSRAKTLRTVNGSDYEISTYRPRTEGIFSRIEHWVNSATGAGHWRTISRDNVSSLYGVDASGSVSNPADRTKVFRYELSRSWDDKGNVAVYDYAAEDSTAIDIAAAHERNRDAAGRSTQRYLKSVRYGNLQPYFPDWSVAGAETPVPTDWMFQVVFDYGDHSTQSPSPTADQPWPVRPDPFSVYRAGFEVRTYRRVHRVLYFHHFPNESSAGADVLVRSTDLVYSDQQTPADPRNPIYTFLVSVTAVGYGKGTQASMPPLTFRYSQPKIQADVESLDAASFENLPEGIDGSRFQWVDLNGEGTPGILSGWDGAWGYKPNLSPVNRIAQPDGSLRTSAEFGSVASLY